MKYHIQVFEGSDGWRWRIASKHNGQVMATSEAYASRKSAVRSASNLAAATGLQIEK